MKRRLLNDLEDSFDGRGIGLQREQDFCLKVHSKSDPTLDARKLVHFLPCLNPG